MKNILPICAVAVGFALPSQAIVIVDAFTDPGAALTIQNTTAGPVSVFTATPGGNTVGGDREVVLTKKSGATSVPSDDITLDIGGGHLGINAANPVTYSFSVVWDGTGEASAPGTLDFGLGLNAFNATSFSFDSALDQLGSASLKIRLYTTAADYAEYDTGFINAAFSSFDIPVASFTQVGSGLNLTSISAIEIFGDVTKPGTDWNLGSIAFNTSDTPPPVPEVSTAVSAVGFAGICLAVLRRRRTATV